MRKDALELMQSITALRNHLLEFNYTHADDELDEHEAVDVGYLYREMSELFDEMRKECNARGEKIGYELASFVVQRYAETPDRGLDVQGTLANGKVDIKVIPIPPKKGDPKYTELCKFLGISDTAIEHGLAQLHYVNLTNYATELAAQGKSIPPNLLTTNDKPICTFRKKKAT